MLHTPLVTFLRTSVFLALIVSRSARADELSILRTSLEHAQTHLDVGPDPAYHIAYALSERDSWTIQGTHGALAGRDHEHSRLVDIDVRVGSMRLDNSHKIRDASWWSEESRPTFVAPLTASRALADLLYRGTDDMFRAARRRLIKVRANSAVKVDREDTSNDFSPAPTVRWNQPPGPLDFAAERWAEVVRTSSSIYLDYPAVHDSAVQIVATRSLRWLVASNGTEVADGDLHFRVATWATTTAEDGMALQVYDYVDVAAADHLPDSEAVADMVRAAAQRLTDLRAAPLVDPYAGPAILRGRAAGVFFHEIFGHRIEGHRQKDEDEGQTFTARVGLPILPSFLSVADDPTLSKVGTTDLNGHYAYDDEGVPAERVSLVDRGILRNFLMSRAPVEGFPRSNGHGRRQPGNEVVARQGNLLVSAHQTVTYQELRNRLLAEVKRQGKPFGLIFDDISGGFTFTGRSEPNAFVVQPVTVWKVFPDGKPDQLVRGVDLIGTPLTTFSRIVAAADDVDVFNGVCGAESGWVPVSATSPSLLVSEVEVQRHEKANDRPPLLPPPGVVP